MSQLPFPPIRPLQKLEWISALYSFSALRLLFYNLGAVTGIFDDMALLLYCEGINLKL